MRSGRYVTVKSPWASPNSIEAKRHGQHRRPTMTKSLPELARSLWLLHFQNTAALGGRELNSLVSWRRLPGFCHMTPELFSLGAGLRSARQAGITGA